MEKFDENITKAASALREARHARRAIEPVSTTFGISQVDQAYAVAEINNRLDFESGRQPVGKKIGLTSFAIQEQLGVDQPDFGTLFKDSEFLNGESVPTSRLIQPRVEGEIAFVLDRDMVSETPSWSEFINSLSYALPALEVVDSAIADWRIGIGDTIADNASYGVHILGDQPVAITSLSFDGLGMKMSKNGSLCSVGSGAACLGHPLRAAYWLVRTMANQGDPLKAGELILSGALGPMVPVNEGDWINLEIGGLGNCAVNFS